MLEGRIQRDFAQLLVHGVTHLLMGLRKLTCSDYKIFVVLAAQINKSVARIITQVYDTFVLVFTKSYFALNRVCDQ